MVVVVGLPGYGLSSQIARALGAIEAPVYHKVFPDGELYVRIVEPGIVKREVVVVVSTLYPDQASNLLKTLLLVDAAKRAEARRVIATLPYLAYSRQDKVFLPGEPVSACLVLKALRSAGADALVTVDMHNPHTLECFGGDAVNLLVSDILLKHAIEGMESPIVIAPDKGAFERAKYAATALGLELDLLVKERDRVTGAVSYRPCGVRVQGRDVVIVDDIISTGGTIAEAARILYEAGARNVVVAATHGLLVGEALSKMESAGVRRVVLADTLLLRHSHPLIKCVDVTERISEALKKII